MTFLLTQTAFSRLRPHNQDLPLDLVDKFRLADHNLPPKIMTTGLAGGLFCGYKPLFPACV